MYMLTRTGDATRPLLRAAHQRQDGTMRRTANPLLICVAATAIACALVAPGATKSGAVPQSSMPAALATESGAEAAVAHERESLASQSTSGERQLDSHLASLLRWIIASYSGSGDLELLPATAPVGGNANQVANLRLRTLSQTYWLQDNALYGARALGEYAPALGARLDRSWRSKWAEHFPQFCPDTQSGYVVGIPPEYDTQATPTDVRCRLPRPSAWQFFRMYQYPSPASADFDSLPKPIIGTDYPVSPQGRAMLAPIRKDNVRDLLKYGCLRQATLGNRSLAQSMFDLALTQWDGTGFRNAKNGGDSDPRLAGVYWTRDVAFALLCANALGEGQRLTWTHGVSKAALERTLWSAQSDDGGFWTNYCAPTYCGGRRLPTFAKETNEIAPLVLLAYGPNIWSTAK